MKDYFSPIQYPITLAYAYRLNENYRFFPELDYTLFNKKGEDGGTEENDLLLRLPFVRNFKFVGWSGKLGLVFHQNKVIGQGGAVTLNNGTGVADFYLPNDTSNSNSFKTEIGLLYEDENFILQTNLLIESPFNATKRNYSLLTGFIFRIGSL